MSKAKRPFGGYELVFNEATCLRCGTPVGRGCACDDLLALPGEPVATVNHGYEDDDLLALPGDAAAPFAVNDRVTWVTDRGRRAPAPSSASATPTGPPRWRCPAACYRCV